MIHAHILSTDGSASGDATPGLFFFSAVLSSTSPVLNVNLLSSDQIGEMSQPNLLYRRGLRHCLLSLPANAVAARTFQIRATRPRATKHRIT